MKMTASVATQPGTLRISQESSFCVIRLLPEMA